MKKLPLLLASLCLLASPAGAQTPAGMSLIDSAGKAFHMGDSKNDPPGATATLETPVRRVIFTKSFYLGQNEVTYAEWKEVRDWAVLHGYADISVGQIGVDVATGLGRPDTTDNRQHPATMISWTDVVLWCNARSEKEGLTPCYTLQQDGRVYRAAYDLPLNCNWAASGYRLPTIAEWEYAARGGVDDGRRFPWGDEPITHARANYRSNFDAAHTFSYDQSPTSGYHPLYNGTAPVGSFPATGFGLRDMAGNIDEWCWDWMPESGNFSSRPDPETDPHGDLAGTYRAHRSGAYANSALALRCAWMDAYVPRVPVLLGFRVARTVLEIVPTAPVFTIQPASTSGYVGGSASFTVSFTGSPTPTCLWRRQVSGSGPWSDLTEGSGYTGVATTTLTVTLASTAQSGDQFRCVATNSSGSVNSTPAALTVTVAPPGSRLINISTRSLVRTGDEIQIAGFVVTGPVAKRVIIRAAGPALTAYGVTGVLADPTLTLYSGSTVLNQNDDWDAALAPEFARVGAAAWTTGSHDAALLVTLPPGMYTALVSGKNSGTGVALIEVYEADAPAPASKLINISTRSFVGTGDNIQIAGLVIQGGVAKKVLIRANGPALTPYGVAGVLADPTLTVYSGSTVLYQNDNWDAALSPDFLRLGAAAWTAGSRDAALLVTLPPGMYTVHVSGANSGTGVALIEVYDAD